VEGHEDTSTALSSWTLAAEALNLAVRVDLVVLKNRHLHLLALVLNLLGGAVVLLLALLSTTTQTENEVKGGLLLDVVVRESAAILKLLASEDQALLIGRDTLLVLDLCLHIIDRVRGLNLESDSFTRKGFYENLHVCRNGSPGLSNDARTVESSTETRAVEVVWKELLEAGVWTTSGI